MGIFSWPEEEEECQADHICKALVLGSVMERCSNSKDVSDDLHWDRLDPIRGRVLFRITT